MAAINLERLRVRQRYFIPIKRENLAKSILMELVRSEGNLLVHITPWTFSEHGNCLHFCFNYRFAYVIMLGGFNLNLKKVKKLEEKYDKDVKEYFKAVEYRRSCMPDEIYVTIMRSEENGCEIEVECLPNLYRRISQLHIKQVEESEIQDAYLTCERQMRIVFLGGLSGTILSEKKFMLPTSKVHFLINDVSIREISEKVNEMLDGATGEVLIFGWIGTILLKKLQELKAKGIKIKVITGNVKVIRQDPMRKEKERAFKELISIIGKDNISIKPEFHGRAILIDNKALIGSMDLDSYSLTGTRIEFAIYTEDLEIVRSLRNYFNRIFIPWKEKEEEKENLEYNF